MWKFAPAAFLVCAMTTSIGAQTAQSAPGQGLHIASRVGQKPCRPSEVYPQPCWPKPWRPKPWIEDGPWPTPMRPQPLPKQWDRKWSKKRMTQIDVSLRKVNGNRASDIKILSIQPELLFAPRPAFSERSREVYHGALGALRMERMDGLELRLARYGRPIRSIPSRRHGPHLRSPVRRAPNVRKFVERYDSKGRLQIQKRKPLACDKKPCWRQGR